MTGLTAAGHALRPPSTATHNYFSELSARHGPAAQKETQMKRETIKHFFGLLAVAAMLAGTGSSRAEGTPDGTVPVTMTVTASVAANKRMPQITRDDVTVKLGGNRLEVIDWAPARSVRAGLELFILIDETADSRLSLQYEDLRGFINDQPPTTLIGVGYMSNGTVRIAQDLTADHVLAAKALRIPLGVTTGVASPYLSAASLMKRWPVDGNRREVILLTDGVGRNHFHLGWGRSHQIDPDADTAAAVAQKTGTNIFSIYSPSSSRLRRNYWTSVEGQMSLARLSDRTGGASFYLGTQSPVSIQPYLAKMQTMLNNQYILSFSAKPGKKAAFQPVKISTEVAGVDLAAHDAVWVTGGK
jgi:hypothetical protein